MIFTLEAVIFISILAGGVLIYRRLVNNVRFRSFIESFQPDPEGEEVAESIRRAKRVGRVTVAEALKAEERSRKRRQDIRKEL
jgi:hypothetical protein